MMTIDTGADTRIELDATNSVTLLGLSEPCVLQASDFNCLIFSQTAFELRCGRRI